MSNRIARQNRKLFRRYVEAHPPPTSNVLKLPRAPLVLRALWWITDHAWILLALVLIGLAVVGVLSAVGCDADHYPAPPPVPACPDVPACRDCGGVRLAPSPSSCPNAIACPGMASLGITATSAVHYARCPGDPIDAEGLPLVVDCGPYAPCGSDDPIWQGCRLPGCTVGEEVHCAAVCP